MVGGHVWIGVTCILGGIWHIFSTPTQWAKRMLVWSAEAYLSYSEAALAYMGFLAAAFVTFNTTVYPEVFYGPVGTTVSHGEITTRTWLALFHIIFACLLLAGHFWHGLRARAKQAGFDFSRMQFTPDASFGDVQFEGKPLFIGIVQADQGQPEIGNLATPINNSNLSLNWIQNLPFYRPNLAPGRRGLEIGMAHGYFLVGPFLKLGPMRNTDLSLLAGWGAAVGLIVILTFCLELYGTASFSQNRSPEGVLPTNIQSLSDWRKFARGFFTGGVGGAIFASFLLFEIVRAGL